MYFYQNYKSQAKLLKFRKHGSGYFAEIAIFAKNKPIMNMKNLKDIACLPLLYAYRYFMYIAVYTHEGTKHTVIRVCCIC